MYELHAIEFNCSDYEIINKCFKDTMIRGTPYVDKIYRVEERHQNILEKSDNILLFHGASLDNAVGILKGGFKP